MQPPVPAQPAAPLMIPSSTKQPFRQALERAIARSSHQNKVIHD
jgi:hypothetical protein